MAACIRVAPQRDDAQRAKENHAQAPRGQKMCFGKPAGYEKLSDREARFAAICLGYSNFHFSRLLSGSERTIAPLLVLRQPADICKCL
jgi:hypothetical protein